MTMKEEVKKFAEENGLDEAEVLKAVKKVAICREIEKIAFRADTALCTELSLIYDDLSLCETPEERGKLAEGKLANALATQKALHATRQFCVEGILRHGHPVRIPSFFSELRDVERTDDDEKIAEHLLRHSSEVETVLREYLAEELEGGSDEHS